MMSKEKKSKAQEDKSLQASNIEELLDSFEKQKNMSDQIQDLSQSINKELEAGSEQASEERAQVIDAGKREEATPVEGAGEAGKARGKRKKWSMNKKVRYAVMILGVILTVACAAMVILKSSPSEKEERRVLANYSIKTDASYRVHLLPNDLFATEWMEENQLYSALLTDFVEINFRSKLQSAGKVDVKGEYSIVAVFEGFQERKEEKKIIYERRYPIASGTIEGLKTENYAIDETMKVDPNFHRDFAEKAEKTLGGSTSRNLYVLFEGKYLIGEEEYPFSYKIEIPVSTESYYGVTKPEEISENGELVETETVSISPPLQDYLIYLAVGILSLLVLIFVSFFVRAKQGDEIWAARMTRLIKKFGSRMICVDKVPSQEGCTVLRLKEMASMISLSEELREPVLYCLDEDALPLDGKFYIFSGEYMYLLHFPKPSTTLEE